MIDVQTLVDNAIQVNKEEYLRHINQFHYWDKKDHENGQQWAVMHHHSAHEIEETIKRIFGNDHIEYIENQFTKIRVYESDLYSE